MNNRLLMLGAAGILSFSLSAIANEPVELTDQQMDAMTAGIGANNVALVPWDALSTPPQEFSLNHNLSSDAGAAHADSLFGVAVPSPVPKSFCLLFCP